jgi:hypothetical protein
MDLPSVGVPRWLLPSTSGGPATLEATMRGHSVLRPDTSPHQPAPNDAVLLLADLVAARRVGDRAWLLEPSGPPSVCPACAEAYRAANYVIAQYGGVEAWLKSFEARERV